MNRNRSKALGAGLLLVAACGQQAGEDYRGEPLLRMRGQAVVSALTGGQAIEPALCFFMADLPKAPDYDGSNLPADIRAKLMGPYGELVVEGLNTRATHILDVESRGEFPAQFDIEVYLPPPSAGLSASWVSGESRYASGRVCAVPADHPAVAFPLASGGVSNSDSSKINFAVASLNTSRFYYEEYDCPPGTLPQLAKTQCTKTSAGDPSLAYEARVVEDASESVLGTAREVDVLYLEADAPPGTFTAWRWGAANGLSAGYHLFAPLDVLKAPSAEQQECQADAFRESERLNNEELGAQIKELFGDDFFYNAGTAYSNQLQNSVELPDDLRRVGLENEMRLLMEHCALEPREELDPGMATLSINVTSTAGPDLTPHLGFAAFNGDYDGDGESEGAGEDLGQGEGE